MSCILPKTLGNGCRVVGKMRRTKRWTRSRQSRFLESQCCLAAARSTQPLSDSNDMQLRFNPSEIQSLSAAYVARLNDRNRTLTDKIVNDVFPRYITDGYLTKRDFLTVCDWKTPRTKSRCATNDESYVRDISALALTTNSVQLRIEIWTLLYGVNWPTASVFLHFAMPDKYPILDFRAIWSLNSPQPTKYTFDYWKRFSESCRSIANEHGVSMRTLDQSLWEYSKRNQNVG